MLIYNHICSQHQQVAMATTIVYLLGYKEIWEGREEEGREEEEGGGSVDEDVKVSKVPMKENMRVCDRVLV